MPLRGTVLDGSIRDYGREQSILAVGRRINGVRLTDAWRSFLGDCIGPDMPVEQAWPAVVGECVRYLVNARAITGGGLALAEIAEWVSSLAERHGVEGTAQSALLNLARDIIVIGLMASGEEMRSYSMIDGTLVYDHVPAIVEEREPGRYQATLETMDFAFRNLDYERAYDQAFKAKDIMLMRQVESGNYGEAEFQVGSLRRSVAMVSAEYKQMMDGESRSTDAGDLGERLGRLALQMESIVRSEDLDTIADRLSSLATSGVPRRDEGSSIVEARSQLRRLISQVNGAKEDIHDVMRLRPQAEQTLQGRLERGSVVTSKSRTVDLLRLVDAATVGDVSVDDLVDVLVVSGSRPIRMGRVEGWGTMLASAAEGVDGNMREAGIDLDSLEDVVDVWQARSEAAKKSMGESLGKALDDPERALTGVDVRDWVAGADESERFEWLDTGVLRAFLHALHVGGEPGRADSDADWSRWLGGVETGALVMTNPKEEGASVDAWSGDGAVGWDFGLEGRWIRVVE